LRFELNDFTQKPSCQTAPLGFSGKKFLLMKIAAPFSTIKGAS
jgi:hypothetical protein